MNFKSEFFDLSPFLRNGVQPSIVIKRPTVDRDPRTSAIVNAKAPATGKFWVPNGPIISSDVDWSFCNKGDHVMSFFHAYLTPTVSPATIWPCGIQTGILALESFQKRTNEIPEVLYLFCGNEVYDKGGKLQCLLALAMQVKETP